MADTGALGLIEDEVRTTLADGGTAAVGLARLLDAVEHGAPPDSDARRHIDALAVRVRASYHINGPKGVIVFQAVVAT